jgi:hypothetical protein
VSGDEVLDDAEDSLLLVTRQFADFLENAAGLGKWGRSPLLETRRLGIASHMGMLLPPRKHQLQ